MEKEIQTYTSMNKAIEQETTRGNVWLLIQWIVGIATVIFLTLAALCVMQRFIEKAEAASVQYGYCVIEDSELWKNINMLKVGK